MSEASDTAAPSEHSGHVLFCMGTARALLLWLEAEVALHFPILSGTSAFTSHVY